MSHPDPEFQRKIRETLPRVHLSTVEDYGVVAEVESSSGDNIYQVMVMLDQGDLVTSCRDDAYPCPYWKFNGAWCKHVYATILKWAETKKSR